MLQDFPLMLSLRSRTTRWSAWLGQRDAELALAGLGRRMRLAVGRWLRGCGRGARETLAAALLRHLPYRWLLSVSAGLDVVPRHRRDARRRVAYGSFNLPNVIGAGVRTDHARLWRHKRVLEAALAFRNRSLIRELEGCAARLADALQRARAHGRPVILAPLHMHSDLLATLVCARASAFPTAVITAHDDSTVSARDEAALRAHGNLDIQRLNPLALDDGAFLAFMRRVRKGQGTLVAFPDAPPEVTYRVFRRSMRTYDCRLFDRPARLHQGVPELARLCGAHVLFFCLTRRHGRFAIDEAGCVAPDEVADRMPAILQRAVLAHPHEWLFWHTPSLFSFNSADR